MAVFLDTFSSSNSMKKTKRGKSIESLANLLRLGERNFSRLVIESIVMLIRMLDQILSKSLELSLDTLHEFVIILLRCIKNSISNLQLTVQFFKMSISSLEHFWNLTDFFPKALIYFFLSRLWLGNRFCNLRST